MKAGQSNIGSTLLWILIDKFFYLFVVAVVLTAISATMLMHKDREIEKIERDNVRLLERK